MRHEVLWNWVESPLPHRTAIMWDGAVRQQEMLLSIGMVCIDVMLLDSPIRGG